MIMIASSPDIERQLFVTSPPGTSVPTGPFAYSHNEPAVVRTYAISILVDAIIFILRFASLRWGVSRCIC